MELGEQILKTGVIVRSKFADKVAIIKCQAICDYGTTQQQL